MTYNIQFGGVDDDGTRVVSRLPLIHEVVRQARRDVLAVQEANGFDQRDFRRLFAFERAVGMRSIFVQSPYGFHGLMLLRPEFAPVSMRNDYPLGNHLLVGLVLRTPGGAEMTVHNVHLDTYAPQQRVDGILRRLSGPTSVVMGDFNNLPPDDPGAEQLWQALSPAYQTRVSGASCERADDRVFQAVELAGHVDLFRQLHPHDRGATVRGAEGLRVDYVFATADLATRVTRCEVFDTAPAREASDHFPVVTDFELDQGFCVTGVAAANAVLEVAWGLWSRFEALGSGTARADDPAGRPVILAARWARPWRRLGLRWRLHRARSGHDRSRAHH